ncbi:MAG: cation:proton antiporter [Oscillospiraceae bacterium]|nr:cation:proton antiporter [Oscillospiraceae bacterium]
METYNYLLWIALILLSTKVLGLMTERIHLPQVVGALIAGILLGPSFFGVVMGSDFLTKAAEIGVILLMFLAGMETEISELKKTGAMALLIAVLGVIAPVLLCGGVYFWYLGGSGDYLTILRAAYMGTVFAATSVSITVETLQEMGKLKTKVGSALLGAALIDDIIGIIALSVISGLSSADANIGFVLLKILLFFVFIVIVSFLVHKFFMWLTQRHSHSKRLVVWSLAFCLMMSWCAEALFGVADITGAYFAGLMLCNLHHSRVFLAKKMSSISYAFFSPVFFASIGIETNLRLLSRGVLVLSLFLLLAAILSKIIGCGAAARICGMARHDSLSVGVGMMSRGEVALMVVQKGIAGGMIGNDVLPAVVLVIILSTLLTPVMLKFTMAKPTPGTALAEPLPEIAVGKDASPRSE